MKKILAFTLALSMFFCTACGSSSGKTEKNENESSEVSFSQNESELKHDELSKDRNGFDYEKGLKFKDGGLLYTIPDYYKTSQEGIYNNEIPGDSVISIDSEGKADSDFSVDLLKNKLKNQFDDSYVFDYLEEKEIEICGFKAMMVKFNFTYESEVDFGYSLIIDNTECELINSVLFFQPNDAEYNYSIDFEKMLDSIEIDETYEKPKRNEADSAQEIEPIDNNDQNDRNGFDYDTGKKYKNGGLLYTLPNYYSVDKDKKNIFAVNESDGIAMLGIFCYSDLALDKDLLKKFVNSNKGKGNTVDYLTFSETEVCGFDALICRINLTFENGAVALGNAILIKNTNHNLLNGIMFLQRVDSKADYEPDFVRMLDNIKIDEDFKLPEDTDSTSNTVSSSKEEKVTEKKEEQPKEVPIKATNFYVSSDYAGKSVLVVEYQWTNTESRETYFSLMFNDKVYQNGVECRTAFMCPDVDAQALLTAIQPGATYTVKQAYVLNDTSQANLVVKPLLSFSDEKYIDMKINIS